MDVPKRIYARPLNNSECVSVFLSSVLQLKPNQKIISSIVNAETGITVIPLEHSTLLSPKHRVTKYASDADRWKLRQKIVTELYTKPRLANDDLITLGKGGALPPSGSTKNEGQAIVIIGLPASGKSSVASKIANQYGAVIIDSDYAKRKLPEYNSHFWSATLVHAESNRITLKYKNEDKPASFKTLYELCVEKKHNIVIPTIGQDIASLIKLVIAIKKDGYAVHLTLLSLDRREATIRALNRYKRTKRYVPLGLIFDEYSNDPTLSYFRAKTDMSYKKLFKSFGEIDSLSFKGIECINNNPSNLFP